MTDLFQKAGILPRSDSYRARSVFSQAHFRRASVKVERSYSCLLGNLYNQLQILFSNSISFFPTPLCVKSDERRMEIVRSQRRNASDGSGGAASLPLYKSAPSLEVRLEEFERCAVDRLRGNLYILRFVIHLVL